MEGKGTPTSGVINLVLIGKTGNGKSATANSIVGRKAFVSCSRTTGVTETCQLEHVTTKDGRKLNVIDTPGFFDPNVKLTIIGQEIVKCIELAKEGLHGVLFVLSIRNRFSEEEANALKALQKLFGENIMKYVVVIFTGGDELEANEQTFEDYSRGDKQIKKLLLNCNQRKVIFDNRAKSGTVKEKQVTELLNHIESIMLQNESRPYSNSMFHEFQEWSNWCENIKSGGYSKEQVEILLRKNEKEHGEQVQETMRKIFEQQLADERNARAESERRLQNRIRELEQESCPGFSISVNFDPVPEPDPCVII